MAAFEQGILLLGDLLQTRRLSVPFWQRAYAWRSTQVKDFWDDLEELATSYPNTKSLVDHNHFMGAIILVGDWKSKALEILDGQQRLATSAILLRSFAKRLLEIGTPTARVAAQHIEREYLTTVHPLRKTADVHLHLGTYDDSFFHEYIIAPTIKAPRATKESHGRIVTAAKKFDEALLELPESRVLHLFETLSEHFYFLYLVFPSSTEAMEIFEVLNDRGIGLSTEELVRGYLLQAAKRDGTAETRIVAVWDELFDVVAQPRGRGFLRHYWISIHGDVKARSLNRIIRADISSRSDPKRVALRLTEDLLQASRVYSDILNADFSNVAIASRVSTLVDLGAIATFPALLSTFRTFDVATSTGRTAILTVLNLLIVAFVRHRIVGQLDNSDFERFAFKIAPMISSKELSRAEREVIRAVPGDAEFLASFKTASVKQSSQAHYLLRRIEAYKSPASETGIAPPLSATLEHVYPRKSTAQLPSHDDVVNRIGNLTLIGSLPNSRMQHGAFSKKRASFKQSPFWITKQLANYSSWDETAIARRQGELARVAAKIWTFADLSTATLPR